MSTEKKCVLLIDEALPTGLIANTATILGMSLGKGNPELVGPHVFDAEERKHTGIIYIPVPILKSNKQDLFDLREKVYDGNYENLEIVDFADVAQRINNYDQYIEKFGQTNPEDISYLGLGLYGEKKVINKLTGSLPLL